MAITRRATIAKRLVAALTLRWPLVPIAIRDRANESWKTAVATCGGQARDLVGIVRGMDDNQNRPTAVEKQMLIATCGAPMAAALLTIVILYVAAHLHWTP